MLVLLTPPGIMGALVFGYLEWNWQRVKNDSKLDEAKFEERMSALKAKLERYDWKSRERK